MAFLILSVVAILSSTAAASISSASGYEKMAVVIVEAIVVYSFLAIFTHACIALLRENAFLLDVTIQRLGNYTYNGNLVQVHSETVFTAVGRRIQFPLLLVITEVFAVISAAFVTDTIYRAFEKIRDQRSRISVGTEIALLTTMRNMWMNWTRILSLVRSLMAAVEFPALSSQGSTDVGKLKKQFLDWFTIPTVCSRQERSLPFS